MLPIQQTLAAVCPSHLMLCTLASRLRPDPDSSGLLILHEASVRDFRTCITASRRKCLTFSHLVTHARLGVDVPRIVRVVPQLAA